MIRDIIRHAGIRRLAAEALALAFYIACIYALVWGVLGAMAEGGQP